MEINEIMEEIMNEENENEKDYVMEEAKRLRKVIRLGNKKYPQEMHYAFCIVIMEATKNEYDEFVKDLDLNEEDKGLILMGMLEKKIKNFWSDLDTIVDFGGKIINEFNKVRKEQRGKK
jgi:hypothetical protein